MGFPILRLYLFLLLLLFQLPSPFSQQEKPPLTDFGKQQDINQRIQEKLSSVNRRGGGGGGGHGVSGGHAGSHGGRGSGSQSHDYSNGDKSPYTQGGAVIPLYAAGGAKHHRNDHGHHSSNVASRGQCDPNYLLFSILICLGFVCSM